MTDRLAGEQPAEGRDQSAADERFMREAIAEAQAAAREGEVPIGAVVVYEGKVIARAHNRRELDEDPSAHAEFAAMVAAARALGRWRLTGCTVYVTLEPCCMCAGLMVNGRIDRCVYGAADSKGGALGTLYDLADDARLNHRFTVTAGVLEHECAELLRAFFSSLRTGASAALADEGEPRAASTHSSKQGLAACQAANAVPAAAVRSCRHASRRVRRVLLAVDSFKGSASSAQVETWLAEGMRRTDSALDVVALPVGDGGEGTAEALCDALGAHPRSSRVHDLMGQEIEAPYLAFEKETEAPDHTSAGAFIEVASVAGLTQSSRSPAAALAASTYGVGELVLDAVSRGATTVYLGLGGSATSDGGSGMLAALGARLTDADGRPIRPGLEGLADVAHIELEPAIEALRAVRLVALCDVTNPLVGPRGAVRVFGPQKGLPTDAVGDLDRHMIRFGALLDTACRDVLNPPFRSLPGVPGAGAAGGLGAAVLALGGSVASGVDEVLDLVGFDRALAKADVVVTGEGMLDEQSASGKTPLGVARRARAAGVPVIAVVGGREDRLDDIYRGGIDVVLPIIRRPMSLGEALRPNETRENVVCAGETVARLLRL